ncbi:MAG: exonuclease domain-containing protein [Lachnospiraceae bacterium]|nr:exonuclease domain-containing protein [Lachnospiraceae bacterium]
MQHIMIDLEMNKIEKQWRGKNKLSSELIEIGAVRMDEQFNVVDTYQSYVKPEFGPMDAVIIDLTGITDDKLVGAPDFAVAMDDFAGWIGKEETRYYSWSMSDIRQFQHEAAFKSYPGEIIGEMEKHWTDFQEEFRKLLGLHHRIKLSYAVSAADYEFQGAQHTALADAVNTAEILRLSKDPERFQKVMKPVLDLVSQERQEQTLMDMCPEFFATFMDNAGQDKE